MLKVRPGSHRNDTPKNESVIEASLELQGMRRELRTLGLALAATLVAACSSRGNLSIGSGQSSAGQNVDFGIAYIKRSIPAGDTTDDTAALAVTADAQQPVLPRGRQPADADPVRRHLAEAAARRPKL